MAGSDALRGVRVVDLGLHDAGLLAGQMLADQGAEVVHLSEAGLGHSDRFSSAQFGRGKTSYTLDLHSPEGLRAAMEACQAADVVIDDRPAGVLSRLGLGADAIVAENPQVVHCALPPFPADDAERCQLTAEGIIISSRGGYPPVGEQERPTYNAISIASGFGGFLGATSIVMALIARHRSGAGQRITVPLSDAMFTVFGAKAIRGGGPDDPTQTMDVFGGGIYRCADDRWVMLNTHNAIFMTRLLSVIGPRDWEQRGLLDRDKLRGDLTVRQALQAEIAEVLLSRPAQEWESLLAERGVPIALVRTTAEWSETAQARETGAVCEVDDPEFGHLVTSGPAVQIDGVSYGARPRRMSPDHRIVWSAPRPPSDASDDQFSSSPTDPPLAGIRVLDTTQVLAGPAAGRLLAEFGADVIKVNDPGNLPSGDRYHGDVNRGKRSALMDLKSPEDLAVVLELASSADVVIENFTTGTSDRLGIGWPALSAANPSLVYLSLRAFGASGPWKTWRGYETQGQAATGMMDRLGGDGAPPHKQPYLLNDYGTGVLTAFAAGIGLFRALTGGQGARITTSFARTASALQTRFLVPSQAGTARGPDALGEDPSYRMYRAADRWFFLSAREARDVLVGLIADTKETSPSDGELAASLERHFAAQPVAHWIRLLRELGIEANAVLSLEEVVSDDEMARRGLIVEVEVEAGPSFRGVGNPVRMSPAAVRSATFAPTLGAHTDLIRAGTRAGLGWVTASRR